MAAAERPRVDDELGSTSAATFRSILFRSGEPSMSTPRLTMATAITMSTTSPRLMLRDEVINPMTPPNNVAMTVPTDWICAAAMAQSARLAPGSTRSHHRGSAKRLMDAAPKASSPGVSRDEWLGTSPSGKSVPTKPSAPIATRYPPPMKHANRSSDARTPEKSARRGTVASRKGKRRTTPSGVHASEIAASAMSAPYDNAPISSKRSFRSAASARMRKSATGTMTA